MRAVDPGSPAMVTAVLGDEPISRLPAAARKRLLASARNNWYETGTTEELRRRTGTTRPVETLLVQDGEYDHVDQVSLGGLTVRAGHGATLTSLEWAFRVLASVDELVTRGVRYPDEDHTDWSASCWILSGRRSKETWPAVVAFRHHPSPARRRFVTSYLRTSTDREAIGLRHAGHPDPRVRGQVSGCFLTWGTDDPLTLIRDPDICVRACAAAALSSSRDRTPAVADALAALGGEADQHLRLAGAYGLDLRDGPRTEEAYAGVALLGQAFEHDTVRTVSGAGRRRNERHQP